MRTGLAVLLALALAAGPAFAQQRHGPGKFRPHPGQMNPEERERLREDLNAARRDVYREHPGQGRMEREERRRRAAEPGRFSPEQREQLRRDILDANRELRR